MLQDKPNAPCPCGSVYPYAQCCGQYHQGITAPTAEKLMRSRFSAYVLGLTDYILRSWHPSFRPSQSDMGGMQLKWIHLDILGHQSGQIDDDTGEVTFAAFYVAGGKCKKLQETSRFEQINGQWLYRDGDCTVAEIGRNEPCPCGSHKKFKRCCAVLD
ncbi:MAG: hypothetical protein AUK35_05790 [Zetaproteobacteria bacterium CG2_30_46_52]|nr:MAG: hypothetical protein AUK35_05790 [Zetaproteobacteria bacterium CG2_30_46_52]